MKYHTAIKSIIRAVLFMLCIHGIAFGQISQGGMPVQIQKLKSLITDDWIILPKVDNSMLREASIAKHQQSSLKPFHFAHPFDVSITPQNSGHWYDAGKIKVWQLYIKSTGAYSLNVIFGKFKLPEDARLFIIGAKNGDVKGAYTSDNNQESEVLAIEPIAGDELLVQYEEPSGVSFPGELEISRIAHDFMGVNVAGDHRPLGISGACNQNVNCDHFNGTEDIRDAVCRIIIEGVDFCTGTLVNNTAQNGNPYLLTAYHCIDSENRANRTVFLFNYESPSCTSVDGDVSHSLSGSTLKASFDSLDFALVQLSKSIPFVYRPYFAGWNRRNQAPPSSKSIHHPLGDIKKISTDKDVAGTSSYNEDYRVNAFWKIFRWDYGVTEEGSSGGPLFDQNNLLIGTLTGGAADCSMPTNDFFSKLSLMWEYRTDPSRQLKAWLDPNHTNAEKLNGYWPNSGTSLCGPITNFKNDDTHVLKRIPGSSALKKEYYSGTNNAGYTDFAEHYTSINSCDIEGVSLGIAKAKTNPSFATSMLNVQVYQGGDQPTELLYSQEFNMKGFYPDAMNYLKFTSPVMTKGNFFISYNIQKLHPGDTLAIYLADRHNDATNSFYLKNAAGWKTFNSQNTAGDGTALLTELTACNIDIPSKIDSFDNENVAYFYPNPVRGGYFLSVATKDEIDSSSDIKVYDLIGKEQNILVTWKSPKELLLNFSGKPTGIYFVHIKAGGRKIVGKIAYIL